MTTRSATEVIQDHLMKRLKGDIKEDVKQNYSPDVIILSSFGVFQGHEGVLSSAAKLDDDIGEAEFNYNHTQIEDKYALLEWSAHKGKQVVGDGADSFAVENGKIVLQTVHYSPPKTR